MNINDMELTQSDYIAMSKKLSSEPHQGLFNEWTALLNQFAQLTDDRRKLRRSSAETYDENLDKQIGAEHDVLEQMIDRLNQLVASHFGVVQSSAVKFDHEK